MSFNECKLILNKYNLDSTNYNNFFNFVYKKIARNTKNRFVNKSKNSIDILLCNHPCIKVIPLYKYINKNNLCLDDEIKLACKVIEQGEFPYVYFVYPKNDNFNKHIQVKVPHLEEACSEYVIKIIPYSLNELIKRRKK